MTRAAWYATVERLLRLHVSKSKIRRSSHSQSGKERVNVVSAVDKGSDGENVLHYVQRGAKGRSIEAVGPAQ